MPCGALQGLQLNGHFSIIYGGGLNETATAMTEKRSDVPIMVLFCHFYLFIC
jgi:hypothetical protein